MNKVFLAGRLASDPQQFVTQNGITQSRVSIACNDNWNKNESYFFPCVAWQSTANFINTYLKKGDAVIVDGKLIRRSYVSKEGKTVYVMEVVIETIKPFGSRGKSSENTFANNNYNKTNHINSNQEIQNTSFNNDLNINNSNEFDATEFEKLLKEAEVGNTDDILDISNEQSLNNDNSSNDNEQIVDLDWMNEI